MPLRKLFAATLVALVLTQPLAAQTPAADLSDWTRLQAIPAGTTLHVSAPHGGTCSFVRSDADTLVCSKDKSERSYPRAEVRKVSIAHRGRSALVGAIPGAAIGIGGLIGYENRKCGGQDLLCGLGAGAVGILGVALVPVGAGIGAGTDFTRHTIYKRP